MMVGLYVFAIVLAFLWDDYGVWVLVALFCCDAFLRVILAVGDASWEMDRERRRIDELGLSPDDKRELQAWRR